MEVGISSLVMTVPACPSQIEHLYGLTVFENYLYATNSDNANAQQKTSVIRVNRFNSTDYQVVTRVDKGGALHIYHQRRQPRGERHAAAPSGTLRLAPLILLCHDCFSESSTPECLPVSTPQPPNPTPGAPCPHSAQDVHHPSRFTGWSRVEASGCEQQCGSVPCPRKSPPESQGRVM